MVTHFLPENQNLSQLEKFPEEIPIPSSDASGSATTSIVRETTIREVYHARASSRDPNPLQPVIDDAQDASIIPANRNVRRRVSHSPAATRASSSFETPTKAALREQVLLRDEAVDHLHGELQRFKDRTAMEQASQRSNFIAAAQQQEIASRENTRVAVADVSAKYEAEMRAMQEQIQRLQQETATAQEAAQNARDNEFATRQHAARLDAALQQADHNVKAMTHSNYPSERIFDEWWLISVHG